MSSLCPFADACGRFVRETGFRTVEAMCVVCAGPPLRDVGQEIAERLADGLSDSWSHVRSHALEWLHLHLPYTAGLSGLRVS